MRRSRVALVAAASLAAGALLGPVAASALSPNDKACRSGITIPYDNGETVAYEACRFDKLEAQLNDASRPAPSESPTATPTPTPTPIDSPAPTVTPTTSSPSPTDEPTSASPSPTPTRTPTPTPTPAAPADFPSAATTGVPAGTTLTTYTGPLTITTANTVIDKKTVNGSLVIRAAGVKITNSQINGTVATDEESTGYSFSIADSNVAVGNRSGTGVGAVNFTATRVHVTGGNRSMHCWHDCTIADSYVHGQYKDLSGVSHESGIRMGARAIIRHNTIICDAPDVPPDAGCSADLTGYGDFATVENNTIENNYLGSTTGGFCAYGGSGNGGKPYDQAHDVKYLNNTFGRKVKNDHGVMDCGYYGAVTGFYNGRNNVFTGNVYEDGKPVIAGGP